MAVARKCVRWSAAKVARLTELWKRGDTAGEIARAMGITRGMVSGKRHSLGLPARSQEVQIAAMQANGRRTAMICGHLGRLEAAPPPAPERAAALVMRMQPLAGSNPAPWELRRPGECAFPVMGYGAGTLSCCQPVEPGSPYCHGHREIIAGRPWPPADPAPEVVAMAYENRLAG